MGGYRAFTRPYNFEEAKNHLKRYQEKRESLLIDRGLQLKFKGPNAITITPQWTSNEYDLVTYHKDGIWVSVNYIGLYNWSNKVINQYSGLREAGYKIGGRGENIWIANPNDRTREMMKRCNICDGYVRESDEEEVIKHELGCDGQGDVGLWRGQSLLDEGYRSNNLHWCELPGSFKVCWRCGGVGKYQAGNNPRKHRLLSDSLKVGMDGVPIFEHP